MPASGTSVIRTIARIMNAAGQQPLPLPLHVLLPQHGPLRDPVDHARPGLLLQPLLQRPQRRMVHRAALRLHPPVPPDLRRRDRHDLAEHHRLTRPDPPRPPDDQRRPVIPARRPAFRSGDTRSASRTATITSPPPTMLLAASGRTG